VLDLGLLIISHHCVKKEPGLSLLYGPSNR
jgi:hypothetical protein